jgi:NADPH-dependent F420 reductase
VSSPPKVGFLGGTGIEGKGLAMRFARAGVPVTIGSRSRERAQEKAAEYNAELGQELIRGAENPEMLSESGIVFLTTPFSQAANAIETYRDLFRLDSVLVDVTVPVKSKATPGPGDLPEGSGSQHLAARLPEGFPLVAAFKTLPAHTLAELDVSLDCDVFVCGADAGAKQRVMDVIRTIPNLRPVDAGGLKSAGALERMTTLAIGINKRHKIRSARYRIVGL